MRLPFLKPKDTVPAALPASKSVGPTDDIDAARLRARRRLVGALVLLVVGVIAFPLVFETQPRPIGAQTPVEGATREVIAAAPATGPPAVAERAPIPESVASAVEAAPAPIPAAASIPAPAPTSTPTATQPPPVVPAAVAPAQPPATAPSAASDGARAKALLEGAPTDPAASTGSGRFVVQVGAYAATAPMREVRAKVEKLGLKTYTQVIENGDGKRTRLRVGPFSSKAEAESAAAKLKAAGLPGNLLTL